MWVPKFPRVQLVVKYHLQLTSRDAGAKILGMTKLYDSVFRFPPVVYLPVLSWG